jgi:hypothetical protein
VRERLTVHGAQLHFHQARQVDLQLRDAPAQRLAQLPPRKAQLRPPDAARDVRTRLHRIGILGESGHEHFNGSLIIPVPDAQDDAVEVCGRKLRDDVPPLSSSSTLASTQVGFLRVRFVSGGPHACALSLQAALPDASRGWGRAGAWTAPRWPRLPGAAATRLRAAAPSRHPRRRPGMTMVCGRPLPMTPTRRRLAGVPAAIPFLVSWQHAYTATRVRRHR